MTDFRPAEPDVQELEEDYWSITLGNRYGTVRRSINYDMFVVRGLDGSEYRWTLPAKGPCARTLEHRLAHLLAYFKTTDDALVWCDEQQDLGADGVFANPSKKQDKAIAKAVAALNNGIGALAMGSQYSNEEGCFAVVIPGVCLRYFGIERPSLHYSTKDRAFTFGDVCVRQATKRHLGTVGRITDRFIYVAWTTRNLTEHNQRHTFDTFRRYNRSAP